MQIFPPPHEDPLDVASLPETDETELNYRTRPLAPDKELRLALLVLLVPVPLLISLAAVLNGFIALHFFFEKLILAISLLLAGLIVIRHGVGARVRREMLVFLLLTAAFICGRVWVWLDAASACRLGLILAWLISCLIAHQVAAWILVGPKVNRDTMERWRVNLPGFCGPQLSLDCPELLTYSFSPLLLAPAWWLAAWSATALGSLWLWPLCLIGWLHVAWLLLHAVAIFFVPWPSWQQSWRLSIMALVIFVTYDPYEIRAMGVFRFPTKWLRPIVMRWVLITSVLMVLAFATSAAWPDPVQTLRQGGSLLGQLVCNLLLASLCAPLLLLTILWFTAGALLTRFDRELTKKLPKGVTEWDHYVERIVNSEDELEPEHILIGTSQVGDYPVLVHSEIYDQHMHLLGDSGASKTSLGIAPTATQLIARGDSTVVIVDLKGDKALFEMCRREAARTRKLRFRWVSNEVGHSSFVFNPFLQAHNQRLSVEQFVDEILQGLSLDYGIAYGAGYFTAMNQIVLTTLLKHVQARSFRELDRYLQNQRFYARIGHAEDWAQARHLGSLVSRLAATECVNVVPGMYSSQPEVHAQAIDALNVFEEPQVVYLWLRSAIESSNAPAIARLFLWAMFSAASHAKRDEQRVYFFIDEFQQVLSDGIKLIFEQFRGLGGTLLAAHQTAGQLRRQGTDLGETVDSCTAVKQVYRASNLESLEQLEKLSGSRLTKVAHWVQPHEPGTGDLIDRLDMFHAEDGLINVRQTELPRLDRKRMLEISSQRQASLVRFTFGSGYTQFAGASVPIVSQYPISKKTYDDLQEVPWPQAPGAFVVPARPMHRPVPPATVRVPFSSVPSGAAAEYVAEFDRRGGQPDRSRSGVRR